MREGLLAIIFLSNHVIIVNKGMKHFIKLLSCKLSLTIQRNMTSIFNAKFFNFLQTSFSLKSFNIRKPIKFKGKISESVNITLYFSLGSTKVTFIKKSLTHTPQSRHAFHYEYFFLDYCKCYL